MFKFVEHPSIEDERYEIYKNIIIVEEPKLMQVNAAFETYFALTCDPAYRLYAKLYVSVITLSINDNIRFPENIKQGFRRTVSWNKYRSERRTQTKNNNLDYMIHAMFRNNNRLFIPSFKNGDNDPTINSFDEYYMPFCQ